jgi:hypothetical protein
MAVVGVTSIFSFGTLIQSHCVGRAVPDLQERLAVLPQVPIWRDLTRFWFGDVHLDPLVSDDLSPAKFLFISELLSPGHHFFLECRLRTGTADLRTDIRYYSV